MPFSIQTNVNSLVAQENLRVNSNFQSQTIQRLTSGYRINSSGDDAAGLAIANKYRSDTAELSQGVRNANDGISQLQIIDGGMNNVSKMLDRLRTLSTQASTGTFTDDQRVVANQEFQSLLGEINRQSQSIGLDTNGQFNKALSVFVGGGRAAGTGANSTSNGQVTVDLSSSSVDTKSLGLSGMQAVASSVDLSTTSATSVSKILNDTSNKAALSANPGFSTFYMTGSGFSDDAKIAVSVNLNGVTDATSLASAINSGIQSAGSASTAAASAFKNAGVVASVHTGANGAQQLAFTSSVAAFQVQAGDQMSNALMGNLSTGATGASMATQVVGAAHATAGSAMTANPVYVKITGAGLANPVTLTLANAGATVGSMIQSIQTSLADTTNQPALAASGITLSDVNGHYVLSNSKNQSFSVEVTGDTGNKLGFGAFQASSQASADYTSIVGASYNTAALNNTTAGAAVNMEFSIGGGPAIAINSVSLGGGNAVAAKYTAGAISSPVNIVTGQNDTLHFAVDSHDVNVVLAAAGDSGIATAGTAKFLNIPTTADVVVADTAAAATAGTHKFFAGDANLTVTATAGKATTAGVTLTAAGAGAGDAVVAAGGKNQFLLSLDGGATKTITLAATTYDHTKFAAGGTDATDLVYALQQAVNTQFTGAGGTPTATVGTDGSGHITITSNTVGANSGVAVFDAADNTLSGQLGLAAGMHVGTGFNTMSVSVDGGAAKLITVAAGTYTVGHLNDGGSQDVVKALNDALGAAFSSNTPVASVDGAGKVVITSATLGTASNVTIQDDPGNPGLMGALGLTQGSHAGTDPTSMWVSVDGGAAKQVHLATGTYKAASSGMTGANDVVAALNTALGNAFASNTPVASIDASGKVIITSASKGAGSSIAISDDAQYPGLVTKLGLNSAVSVDGHDGATADTIATQIRTQMGAQLSGTGAGATVAVNNGVITISNNAAGAGTDHAFSAMTGNAAGAGTATAASHKFASGDGDLVVAGPANKIRVTVDGGSATVVTLAAGTYKAANNNDGSANDIVKAMNTALKAAFATNTPVATVNGSGKLVITSASTGNSSAIAVQDDATNPGMLAQLFGGGGAVAAAGSTTTWASGLFTAAAGVNRTGDDLASAITNELAANTTLAAAGLAATWDGTANTITVSSNSTSAFRMNSGAAAAQGTLIGTTDLTNGADFSASPMTLQVKTDGAAAVTVNLSQKYTTATAIAADIKNQLSAAGSNANVTTTSVNGKTYLELQAVTTGSTGSVQVLSGGTANTTLGLTDTAVKANSAQVDVGFGVTNSTSTGALGLAKANSSLSVINASGTSQTGALAFQGLTLAGGKTQSLTISANDANGGIQSTTITLAATGAGTVALANDGTGKDLDSAVKFINSQLQQTNNDTLKQIVAVKEVVGGAEEVNFISANAGFQVGIGATTNKEGLNAGVAKAAAGVETGASSTVSILSKSDALAAVSAVATAIGKLGTAQAAIGKGQNQLNYAVNLAQSQISNFSAAESRIRDADVAAEAANLTKASVLQQASIAAMSQANSAPQAVLSLLRG